MKRELKNRSLYNVDAYYCVFPKLFSSLSSLGSLTRWGQARAEREAKKNDTAKMQLRLQEEISKRINILIAFLGISLVFEAGEDKDER